MIRKGPKVGPIRHMLQEKNSGLAMKSAGEQSGSNLKEKTRTASKRDKRVLAAGKGVIHQKSVPGKLNGRPDSKGQGGSQGLGWLKFGRPHPGAPLEASDWNLSRAGLVKMEGRQMVQKCQNQEMLGDSTGRLWAEKGKTQTL